MDFLHLPQDSLHSLWNTAAWTALIGLGVIPLIILSLRRKKEVIDYDEIIDLLMGEELGMIYAPTVSAMTLYSGDISTNNLKSRFIAIMKQNPWLASRLIYLKDHKRQESHLKAVYKKEFNETDIDQYYQEIVVDPSNNKQGLYVINEKMPIDKITELLRSELVKLGVFCIGKAKEPLVKVIVLKFLEEKEGEGGVKLVNRSAMVFSLSHVLGDGHTFYHLLSFFDTKKPIKSLIAKRIPDFPDKIDEIYGKSHQEYLKSIFLIPVIYNRFISRKPEMNLFTINQKKIEELKQSYQAKIQTDGNFSRDKSEGKAFISTNDIITSWFLTTMGNDYGLMAMNYRNRLEGYTDDHAGNYEGGILYHRNDYQSPVDIRESVQTLLPKSRRIPTLKESWDNNFGVISNWSSFYHTVNYPNCENIAHFPLLDSTDVLLKDVMIMFQRKPNELALWMGSRSFKKVEHLRRAADAPVILYDE